MLPPRRYPYFGVVVGLAWSYDPESYAGGSVAAGRVYHAGQVKGDDPDKKAYPALQVGDWTWSWRPHPVKSYTCWGTFNDCSSNRKRGQGSS
jgi:hypothetical protein